MRARAGEELLGAVHPAIRRQASDPSGGAVCGRGIWLKGPVAPARRFC